MRAVAVEPATLLSWSRPAGRDDVQVRMTDRRHGDLAVGREPVDLAPLRSAIVDRPWSWLRQVHGGAVVAVGSSPVLGAEADALVTDVPGAVLAVHTADCAPVALVSREGPVGVVHAGWRGVVAGVLPAAVDALRSLGAQHVDAWLGPCIGPECYEFGAADLADLAAVVGDGIRATTSDGRPALDLRAAVRASLAAAGVAEIGGGQWCTAHDVRWYSHRARAEQGRQALVAWIEP